MVNKKQTFVISRIVYCVIRIIFLLSHSHLFSQGLCRIHWGPSQETQFDCWYSISKRRRSDEPCVSEYRKPGLTVCYSNRAHKRRTQITDPEYFTRSPARWDANPDSDSGAEKWLTRAWLSFQFTWTCRWTTPSAWSLITLTPSSEGKGCRSTGLTPFPWYPLSAALLLWHSRSVTRRPYRLPTFISAC